MKKRNRLNIALLCLAITIMLGGCEKNKYDDTALQNRIAELEEQKKRVDELEKQQKDLEAQQKDLENFIAAFGNNDYITNITPVSESGAQVGYTITFSDSSAIKLYNGLIASITINDNATVTFTLVGGKKITVPLYPGDGTEASPRMIFNANDLDAMRQNLDWHYKLMADITVTDWLSVGDNMTTVDVFSGNFNGNGHTITISSFGNVLADRWGDYNYGLFGRIEGGTVSKLHVTINAGTIRAGGVLNYGGIVGHFRGSGALIENCSVSGAISAMGSSLISLYVGGIAGYNSQTIKNCYATGSVSATDGSVNQAGGIVGVNIASISACVALQSSITGDASYSGRVAGSGSGTVTYSYANDEMTVNNAAIVDGTDTNKNGADCDAQPAATWWQNTTAPNLGWDWTTIWTVTNGSYPKLR